MIHKLNYSNETRCGAKINDRRLKGHYYWRYVDCPECMKSCDVSVVVKKWKLRAAEIHGAPAEQYGEAPRQHFCKSCNAPKKFELMCVSCASELAVAIDSKTAANTGSPKLPSLSEFLEAFPSLDYSDRELVYYWFERQLLAGA